MDTKKLVFSNRIAWIDILRGLGIILMVFGHICYSRHSYDWINSFHMAIFFFAAGYVYRRRPVLQDLKRRAYSLLVPYFLFGFLTLLYWYFIERRIKYSDETFLDALIGLLRGQLETISYNIPLWFIPCFFLAMSLYNLLMNCCKRRHAHCLILLATVLYVFVPPAPMLWGIDKLGKYMIFIVAGELFAQAKLDQKIIRIHPALRWLLIAVLLTGSIYISTPSAGIPDMWFLTAFLGCAWCILLSLTLGHCRPLQYLGRASLLILCIHGAVYRVLIELTLMASGQTMEALRLSYLYALAITILTLLICCGIYIIIRRFAPWMLGEHRQK